VLAHEVAHVTQHHIARLLGKQEQMSIPTLVAVVLAFWPPAPVPMWRRRSSPVQEQAAFNRSSITP